MYFLSVVYSVSGLPAYTAPLSNDYLHYSSLGLFEGLAAPVNFVSTTLTTSGTVYLQSYVSINTLFCGYAVMMMLTSAALCFTLKDKRKPPSETTGPAISNCRVALATVKQSFNRIREEKAIIVAMWGLASATITNICIYQFGIPLYLLQYDQNSA